MCTATTTTTTATLNRAPAHMTSHTVVLCKIDSPLVRNTVLRNTQLYRLMTPHTQICTQPHARTVRVGMSSMVVTCARPVTARVVASALAHGGGGGQPLGDGNEKSRESTTSTAYPSPSLWVPTLLGFLQAVVQPCACAAGGAACGRVAEAAATQTQRGGISGY